MIDADGLDIGIREVFDSIRLGCLDTHRDNPTERDECLRVADNNEYVGTEIYTTCTCSRSAEAEREEAIDVCNAEFASS